MASNRIATWIQDLTKVSKIEQSSYVNGSNDQPSEELTKFLQSDNFLNMSKILEKHNKKLNVQCKLYIDSETLKPMYLATIDAPEVGEALKQSNKSRSEALNGALEKFRNFYSLKFDSITNQVETKIEKVDEQKISKSILSIADIDSNKFNIFKIFNKVVSECDSPKSIINKFINDHSSHIQITSESKYLANIKIYSAKCVIVDLCDFQSMHINKLDAIKYLVNKVYNYFAKFLLMIDMFKTEYSSFKQDFEKFTENLVANNKEILSLHVDYNYTKKLYEAMFTITNLGNFYGNGKNENNAKLVVCKEVVLFLKKFSEKFPICSNLFILQSKENVNKFALDDKQSPILQMEESNKSLVKLNDEPSKIAPTELLVDLSPPNNSIENITYKKATLLPNGNNDYPAYKSFLDVDEEISLVQNQSTKLLNENLFDIFSYSNSNSGQPILDIETNIINGNVLTTQSGSKPNTNESELLIDIPISNLDKLTFP